MPIRRRNYSRKHLWSLARRSTIVLSLVIAIVAILPGSALYFTWEWKTSHDTYDRQLIIVDSLQPQAPDERMQMADDILHLQDNGISLTPLNDIDFQMMMEYVAQNGSDPWTTVTPLSWSTYFQNWLPDILEAAAEVGSAGCSLAFILHCRKKQHYLADLPWRTWWVPAFVLSVPLLWVPFAVSAMRMHRKLPAYEAPKVHKKRVSDISGAQTAFFQMRELGTREGVKRLIDLLEDEQNVSRNECEDLAERLRTQQRKLLELKGQLARLHDEDSRPIVPPTPQALEQEFNRLVRLPGVEGVRPLGSDNNALAIRVRASVVHGLHRYYLGTWEIQLKLSGVVQGVEKESGVFPSWRGGGPVYRVGQKFCFGDFDNPISHHLIKGEILEAAALAVQAVNNINPEDKHRIPEAFQCLGRVDKEDAA